MCTGLVVGFLGLGNMGSLMAANVAGAGFPLWIYNRTRSKADALASEIAARTGISPAHVARNCNVVLTMVSDANALQDLYFGPDGIVRGLQPDSTCIEMSTVGPQAIRQLDRGLRAVGARLLDAPVSGSLELARSAQLTMMIGGTAVDLDRVRPVLTSMASRLFHVGPKGAGAALKLAVNAIVYGLNQALAEGLVLAESAGIARDIAYDLFECSAVGAPFVHYRRNAFLKQAEVPVGLSLDLARKDLDLIETLAREVHTSMPQTAVNRQTIESAVKEGRGDQDVTAIAEHLRHAQRDSHIDQTVERRRATSS
jgi:3-hydroxyisobutyrate dehydrogenase-like beta-hydroxyacid dehydrogenase